ncbi:hypothetical protein SAMN04488005_0505 [Yoonia tamlensis]|uniref:Uncharacterized protein n=1 Tax=Yoonia tamlensis TaxID=390270 RepID=A0A1I6FU71_9RHOB|nr:hypothetical protein SAMN04488005_0505 [Yoonia tamlensis]
MKFTAFLHLPARPDRLAVDRQARRDTSGFTEPAFKFLGIIPTCENGYEGFENAA